MTTSSYRDAGKRIFSKASEMKADVCWGFLASFPFCSVLHLLLFLVFPFPLRKQHCLFPIKKGHKTSDTMVLSVPSHWTRIWHMREKTKLICLCYSWGGFVICGKMQNLTNTVILASLKTDVSIAKERRNRIMGTTKWALIHQSLSLSPCFQKLSAEYGTCK